jgi:outer membrane biosynthesis protein TonB
MGMNKYLVTLRIRGQLVKTAVHAHTATHARLLCQYQFGMDCVQVAPTQIYSEGQGYPLLDDLIAESPPSIKPQAPKLKTIKTIKPIKPIKPPTPEQMRITQLKANVDRQKDALQRERENQKRQREAEQARRGQGGL